MLPRPCHQLRHLKRGIKRACGFKNNPQRFATWPKRFHLIGQFFVIASVCFVFFAVLKQNAVQLLDVIFRQRQVVIVCENRLHESGVPRHLLLVAGGKGAYFHAAQQCVHLGVGQTYPFNARGRTDAFNGCDAAQGRQPLRGDLAKCPPCPFELINTGDKTQHFLRGAKIRRGKFHNEGLSRNKEINSNQL